MKPGLWAVIGTLLGPSTSAALSAQQYPSAPPVAGPITPGGFPPFQETVLPNGLRMVLVESHEQPVLSLSLAVPAGGMFDPASKVGLADMVAGLLTKGAGRRGAEELAATIEGVGGSLSAGADPDFLTIQEDVLAPQASLAFELLADVALRPTFDADELELLRRQTLSSLQAELSRPDAVAARIFALGVYGQHPYGIRATPASVRAITKEDLRSFHRARFRPTGALLVVAGDLTPPEARRLATAAFGGWARGAPGPLHPSAPPVRTTRQIILVHRPGSVQSNILVGNTTVPPTDTTLFAATVANTILGGGEDSRLFLVLREQKGWTYDGYSRLTRPRGVGTFQAGAEVRTEVTDSALGEILRQLTRIASEPVTAAELDAAKSALLGSFPLTIQTANQVAQAVSEVKLLGLPANYLQTYRTRLATVTTARLRAVAHATIRPDAALVVVVGDGSLIYDGLRQFGPVRIVSTEGRPLQPEDLAAKKGAVDFDLTLLQPRHDSLVVLVQGRELGAQVSTLERTADGFRYEETSTITGFLQQNTAVSLDAHAAVTGVVQTGQIQGQATQINVTYGSGRVKGSARVAGPKGPKAFDIDTAVPAGVLDDNAIQGLLPAFRWSPNARWDLTVFASGENRVRILTLAVTAVGKVTVPAGTFECYQAQLSGGDQQVAFYLTTAAPHRLIRIVIGGSPIEFVAAQQR